MNSKARVFTKEKKVRIFTIEEIEKEVQMLITYLIQLGYEQADCNDEGWVDQGDAIRILLEDYTGYINVAKESMDLMGTLLRIRSRKAWELEFPGNRSQEKTLDLMNFIRAM
jgi:hypothetical protein